MASQGQSLFAASGDAGAYGCTAAGVSLPTNQALQVGDPNNQPYVTAVGGTSFRRIDKTITFDPGKDSDPAYPGANKELTWIRVPCTATACDGGGSGGGVSRIWGSPDYIYDSKGNPLPGVIETKANGYANDYSQSGTYCNQQPGVQCRENPDVSLNADPATGYSTYCTDPGDSNCATGEFGKPGWLRFGGTSCAAPLWASIAALDVAKHKGRLGLFNYIVYPFDSTAGMPSSSMTSRSRTTDFTPLVLVMIWQRALVHPTFSASSQHSPGIFLLHFLQQKLVPHMRNKLLL